MAPSKTVYRTGNLSSGPKLVIDVIQSGQGNTILVSYPNGNFMLVDCGSQAHGLNNPTYRHVSKYITQVTAGADISCVVLTHGDRDHVSWITSIPEAQRAKNIFYGGKKAKYEKSVKDWLTAQNKRAHCLVWGFNGYHSTAPDADFMGADSEKHDTNVYVLSAGEGETPNDQSVVLLLQYGDYAIVLPGDAEIGTETFIMSKFADDFLAGCTMLVPGHHGAGEATSLTFQNALSPNTAAISSSGTNLSYGHPNCKIMKQLTSAASIVAGKNHRLQCADGKGQDYKSSVTKQAVYLTGTNGDIRFTTDGKNYNMKISSLGT